MSTRYSAHSFSPLGVRSSGGNREVQPGLKEQVSRRSRPKARVIARADSEAPLLFGDAEAGLRRPVISRAAVELPDGGQWTSRLKSDPCARDFMSACVALLRSEDSIERAAQLMSESDSNALPVVDASKTLWKSCNYEEEP